MNSITKHKNLQHEKWRGGGIIKNHYFLKTEKKKKKKKKEKGLHSWESEAILWL